jgi:hypothetical protein
MARFPEGGGNLALALAFLFEAPRFGDLFDGVGIHHDAPDEFANGAALPASTVVRTKNTGMVRGRRPATIRCGPTCLTAAIRATGRHFRFKTFGK